MKNKDIPLVFKPIMIDSVLMFDGGVYNNFPRDVMEHDFNPDLIIGVQCIENAKTPSEDDVVRQIGNLVMFASNYHIPEEKGKPGKTRVSWLAALNISAVLGAILFIVTQNINNPMVWIDFWTIAHIVFVAIEVVAMNRLKERSKDKETQKYGTKAVA